MGARAALRELARRKAARAAKPTELESNVGRYTGDGERVLGHLFDKQLAFVRDTAKRKAAKCGRRAGKTTSVAASLTRTCMNHPGALTGYVTITRPQAKRLIWPELKRVNRHYRLGVEFNESELIAKFPNGSQIWVAGADKEDQIEKFRGVAFLEFVLDECASFKKHLENLIKEVVDPTLEDYGGTVTQIGSPSKACAGIFYDATTSDDAGWSRHQWTVLDNPMFPVWRGRANWKEAAREWFADLRRRNRWGDDDPVMLREWLAKWVRDKGSLVYPYDEALNGRAVTQAEIDGYVWEHILGLDLGHDDATAWAVVAFSRDLPWCRFVHAEKATGLDITDVATRTRALQKQFKPENTVVDTGALGKMIVVEMQKRHVLALSAAEKKDKAAFQEAMAADFRKELILADTAACAPIIAEWETIQKDEDGNEDDRFDNHCADAGLYAWREARHYMHVPKEPKPEVGSAEYYELEEQRMLDEALADDEADEVEDLFA